MVTGSHIPADRNGIKFYRADGEIDKADEGSITRIAEVLEAQDIVSEQMSAPDVREAAMSLFRSRIESILTPRALARLRVGVYQHSTVAREMLVETLVLFGAAVVELGFSESFIPVDTEAVSSETVQQMQAWAKEYSLDAIISADGDGDRPLVTDETGTPIRGDLLGLIAARFLNARVLVTPVTSNSGIEAQGDFKVVRTKVGSPFVITGMENAVQNGCPLVMGFEANGGTLVATPFPLSNGELAPLPTRDSVLPILAVLKIAAQSQEPLSRLVANFNLPCAVADRLEDFPVETSAALMAYLRQSDEQLADFLAPLGKVHNKTDIDGLRVTLSDGNVVHLRPSGNAPEMRCYVEAKNEQAASNLLNATLEIIRAWASVNNHVSSI
ncbi:phosphomannomutase [Rhizobium sp. NFR07]|nr:phosphomannomutase [Rhizobium sp. NFR07]